MFSFLSSNPDIVCGNDNPTGCFGPVLNIVGTVVAALLTLVIAFGQYTAGRRQAASAKTQAQLARVPLLDAEILAVQKQMAFTSSLQKLCENFEEWLKHLKLEVENDAYDQAEISCNYAIETYNRIFKKISEYDGSIENYIIPQEAIAAQSNISKTGNGFIADASKYVVLMEVISNETGEFNAEEIKHVARRLEAGEIMDALQICRSTQQALEEISNELKSILEIFRVNRAFYLRPVTTSPN